MIARKVAPFVDSGDAFEAVDSFVVNYKKVTAELAVATDACQQAVARIPLSLEIAAPDAATAPAAVIALLDAVEHRQNPLASVLEEVRFNHSQTMELFRALAARLNVAASEKGEDSLCDAIWSKFELLGHEKSGLQTETGRVRKALELCALKLQIFLSVDEADLTQMPLQELVQRTAHLCDQLNQPISSREFIHVRDINAMFSGVFPVVPISSTSDPKRYIPEVCAGMLSLHNSVMSLKPFSTVLREMCTVVDTKADALNTNSKAFEAINQKILELQLALQGISPAKVNSLVFAVVKNFTTLLSCFFKAISR
jgi:hypothetical protein